MRDQNSQIEGTSRANLPELRCKRCGKLLGKSMALINGVPAGEFLGKLQEGEEVTILIEIKCRNSRCKYLNFFKDKFGKSGVEK